MSWLTGYTYRKKGAVNSTTAGAQTLYQLKLLVGESSGASGEDVDCEGHCADFPNDIRFTKEDGITKHDYWVEKIEGNTPNRLATIQIEVASIPASGSVDFYMYYEKPDDSGESNGDNTFEFFDDFDHGTGWNPYKNSNNPVASFAAFARIVKDGSTWHMYYFDNPNINHATSPDGITWTDDTANNPVLTPSASGWDSTIVVGLTPIKVGTNDWHALYTGRSGTTDKIGHATSTDGVNWTKDTVNNPVLEPTEPWEETQIETGSILKVGSDIYLWYHQAGGTHRDSGLATSTDWTSWTKDTNNPIFEGTTGEFYHAFSPGIFLYGGKYYLIIAYQDNSSNYAKFRLYEDTSPTFYAANRIDNGWYLSGVETWEDHDMDTFRIPPGTPVINNKIYAFYSGEHGGTWQVGLLQIPISGFPGNLDKWIVDAQTTHFAVSNGVLKINSSGEQNIIRTKDYSASDYIIEMKWKFKYWQAAGREGVLARYGDIHNFYAAWLTDATFLGNQKGMICAKKATGAWTESANYSHFDFGLDVWYDVKFIVEGNNLKGYFEDDLKSSQSWTDFASGKVGLRSWYDNLEIDDFRVRKYASPIPTWGNWSVAESAPYRKVSSAGLCIMAQKTKTSSAGLLITAGNTKVSSAGLLIAPPLYEDFTTFTEVDVPGNRIQKTVNHIDHKAYLNESTYTYKDYGDSHFSDFTHKIKVRLSNGESGGLGYVWTLSNDLGDMRSLHTNNKTAVSLFLEYSTTTTIYLREYHNGTYYHDICFNCFDLNTWIYIKIVKNGSALTAYLYSDASYTTLVDTLNISLHGNHDFKYLFGSNTYNTGTDKYVNTDIDNFNLGPEKTKLSSASLSILQKSTKESTASLSISGEGEKVSSAGIRIVKRFTKESSAGLSIYGGALVVSSGGLAISEKKTKVSSAGISISEAKTKASSAGLRIIEQTLKASSASLTVKAPYTKESSAGMSIVAQPLKQSSGGLSILGKNTLISSGGLSIFEPVLKKGLFYGKLGDIILETVDPESFRISEEINRIPTFEFEVANSEANRTAIAANPTALFKIYWQHHGLDTHIFTGIINADGIEYISLSNIRITGFASYAKLGWPLYKHLFHGDKEEIDKVLDFSGSYIDYTTEAHDATINDVILTFGNVDHSLYIGEANPFWGLQIKYSTKGVPAGAVVFIEFSKGAGIWETLDVLDETNAFTEDPGTYDIIIPHPPSDWARNTVDGVSKFWIRWRIVSGAYTTAPKLDRLHAVNVDVYRVFYLATSAREILLDVLENTEYSMDTIDACPEDEINLLAEYESPLRIIAAIPKALTWTDTDGSKKSYQWWIDEAKKVHIKQKRGTTYSDDITSDLTIFNNLIDYFNLSNRLIGFGKRDGLSQIRAIIEDTASQTTHALRELAVPKNEIGKYITLKESLEKDITYSKDPMQRIKGSVSTEFWGLRNYEVGDTVTLHQGEWVVEEGAFQIVKADIGPILTQLNLGISREHLEGLKSNLKRAFDISNVQMHGSTTLFNAGPETMNYERKSNSEVYSAKLKIEIPSDVVKTHKVLLSWTIGKYRASVNDNSGDVPSHNHDGNALIGGAIDSDFTGDDGGFTPDVALDGLHTPVMIDGLHKHKLEGNVDWSASSIACHPVWSGNVSGGSHRHSGGGTGYPNGNGIEDALIPPLYMGSQCTSGRCVTGVYDSKFANDSHYHQNSDTGYTTPSGMSIDVGSSRYFVTQIHSITVSIFSEDENPLHEHTGTEVSKHDHAGVAESDHDHVTPAVTGHTDHGIVSEPPFTVSTNYGIHEEAAGTVLELLINNEKIGEYEGAQTEIRVDGYLTSGSNTVEIQPIICENEKKGSATIKASGILFIEPKRF